MDICVILCTMDSGGGAMKVTVEQIGLEREEELTVRCHAPGRVSVGHDGDDCRSTDDFP